MCNTHLPCTSLGHTILNFLICTNRFRPKAGPDGGNGGSGGSIVFVADSSLKEFAHIKKHLKAEAGGNGKQNNCMGKNAENIVIKVCTLYIVGQACYHVTYDALQEKINEIIEISDFQIFYSLYSS